LVSVVTGTYQRHDLLLGAIENVRAQAYRPLEHVIIADGPDDELDVVRKDDDVPIIFQELGFWSSGLLTNSISAAPFMVAQLLARGEYQITLSDDERFLAPDAITKLVDYLERYDVDFAYSKAELTFAWDNPPTIIGTNPPMSGQITQFLYKREMLERGMLFRTHVGNATDWDAVQRAMQNRAKWVFVPEVLVTHRVDK
jgi:glycosyltransferase involved in cell wall biosynthesis